MLYELLCGRVPFRDTDLELLLAQIKERAPVPPRSLNERIPARVEDACLRALAKDPAKRFRTAGDFARALQTAIEPRSRRMWLVAAAAAGLTALWLGLIVVAARLAPHGSPSASRPAPELALQLEYPRIDVIRTTTSREVTPRQPAPSRRQTGRSSLELSQGKAYLYVIVFGNQAAGPGVVARQGDDRPSCGNQYKSPPKKFLTVPPGDGVMAVLVGRGANRWRPAI